MYREDGALEVHSVFYTIQGEGPFAGLPAVFIRLYGCNLQCPDCDTEYTSVRAMMPPQRLLSAVHDATDKMFIGLRKRPLIVITGGEPLRQNIWPAVRELIKNEFINVQIETNGTVWQDDAEHVITTTIVCSPKKSYIEPSLRPLVKHLKYVLEAGKVHPEDGLPTATMGYGGTVARPWPGFTGTIWVQPLDAKDDVQNAANVAACVESCKKFGYRMSLQTHKLMQVP